MFGSPGRCPGAVPRTIPSRRYPGRGDPALGSLQAGGFQYDLQRSGAEVGSSVGVDDDYTVGIGAGQSSGRRRPSRRPVYRMGA